MTIDERWMDEALAEAARAERENEVPVGAVLVRDGVIVGRGRNRTISVPDPCAHAEIVALRDAAANLGNYRIGGTIYATLEPCTMCMGALVHARIERLVFAAVDPKAGAAVSLFQLGADERLNHRFPVVGGVRAETASSSLSAFFARRRAERRSSAGNPD